MSSSYGQFNTDLVFDNDAEPAIAERMVLAAAGRQLGSNWSIRLGAGAIVDGTMTVASETHEIGTGWLISGAVARRFLLGGRFFSTASLTIGYSSTSTQDMTGGQVSLSAGDVRLGGIVGATFWNRFSPYALARFFGGPVGWSMGGQEIVGTDQYHYQFGAGASVQIGGGFSALLDASLVGEQSLSLGVTYTL